MKRSFLTFSFLFCFLWGFSQTTVVDVIVNSEEHNILEAAVLGSGLDVFLSDEGPYTVFAPTDSAFAALPEELVDALLANPTGDLIDILIHHVLDVKVLSTELMDGMTAVTLKDQEITITINDDGVFVDSAKVIVADIQTDNGVVHVIDAVLIPVIGGEISLEDGSDEVSICAGDGVDDLVDVELTGMVGPNTGWVITDTIGTILSLPEAPPFNFEGVGAGVCLIWHLSWEGDLTGLELNASADSIQGVFDISNPITVIRNGVDGGSIVTTDGATELSICAGDGVSDAFDVTVTGGEGSNSAWVITDADGNILALPASPPFDLEGAGPGVCLVWYLRFEDGLTGVELGANAGDLQGCFDLSNPITVTRTGVDGGSLTTADGATELSICAGDGVSDAFEVSLTDASGSNSAWVITDADGNILALPAGPPFDLEGAGPGVCLVWHMSFEDGLTGAELGANAGDLQGCFDLSNPITVTRTGVDGGTISTSSGIQRGRVVIANRASGTISVIDSDDDSVIGTYDMPDGGQPMYCVYNGLNNTVLVGDYNGQVVAFDGKDFSVQGTATAGAGVFHMWISPDFGQLWVNNELDKTISVIDPTFLATLATIPIPADLLEAGFKPHDVIVSPDNGSAYVTLLNSSVEENYVVQYDASTFEEIGRVGVGRDPHVSLTSANDYLYVAAQGASQLTVHNRSDLSLITTLDIPNAHGLGMNNDGTYLYVGNISGGGMDAHYIVDLAINTLVGDPVDAPVAVPHNYAITEGNEKLFVTHSGGSANQVSVYELGPEPVLTSTITVENNPFGLVAYSFTDTELTICAGDGASDAFDVTLTGAEGSNSAWVITDADGNILALPAGPPFDLEGAGAGVCLVWHLSFEEGLTGAEVGANAADLQGCFDLSNPITVTRVGANGGLSLTTADGFLEKTICTNDENLDRVDVILDGDDGSGSWVITDADGIILALPDAPPFDLEAIDEDVCLIWRLSGEAEGLEVGANASDMDGCFSLSNALTITKDPSATCVETCLPPASSTVTALSPTSVMIDWPLITEAYIYVVRYRPVGTESWKFASVYWSRREIKNLQPGTTYEYQIQTLCLPEESPLSDLAEFSTPAFALASSTPLSLELNANIETRIQMDLQPNPAIDALRLNYNLAAENGSLTITHISGQKIFETRLSASKDVLEIDLSNVPAGYYVITLNNGKERLAEKLVKASK